MLKQKKEEIIKEIKFWVVDPAFSTENSSYSQLK